MQLVCRHKITYVPQVHTLNPAGNHCLLFPLPASNFKGAFYLQMSRSRSTKNPKVPRIGMTLVTLLAVNTMINGIKAEMPRVKITQHHPRQSLILRSLTSRCPTPGSTPSPTTAASASSSSLLCRQETSSFQHNPCFCSIWWKWRRRMQPSWRNSGRGSSLPFFPSSGSLAMALRPW